MEKDQKVTAELIEAMKARAQLMQDELYNEGQVSLTATGTLTGPQLCDKSAEYENYMLTIKILEERLKNLGPDTE